MRRLRLICGGEEGRAARGSEASNVGGNDVVECPGSAWSSDGAGEEEREGMMVGTEVPGGGAPLTIWSSLDSDMVSSCVCWLDRLPPFDEG